MRHITRRDPPGRLTDRTVTRKDTEKRSQLSAHVISSLQRLFFVCFPAVFSSLRFWRANGDQDPRKSQSNRGLFSSLLRVILCVKHIIILGQLWWRGGWVLDVLWLWITSPGGNQQACQSRYLNSVSDALMTKINCKKRRRVFPRSSTEYS